MVLLCDKCDSKEHVFSRRYGFIGPVDILSGRSNKVYYKADLCKTCRSEIEGLIKGFIGNQQEKEATK